MNNRYNFILGVSYNKNYGNVGEYFTRKYYQEKNKMKFWFTHYGYPYII